MNNNVVFEDRYSATGTPYPDENSCKECDGMGLYPCKAEHLNEEACKTEDNRLVIIGQIESDGDVYKNGSKIGQIENDGDIYRNGSKIGECPNVRREWVAAVVFFFFIEDLAY